MRTALAGAIGQIVLGAGLSLALTAVPMAALAQASRPQASESRNYDIPAGSLEDALNRFGRESAILLSFAPQSTAGLRTQGLHGVYSVQGGLDTLLSGSGWRAVEQGNGSFFLSRAATPSAPVPQAQTELPTMKVYGIKTEAPDGRFDGYAARRSLSATKTDTSILETPQSMSIVGRDEMQARGVQDVMEAIRYSPGVAVGMYGPDNRGWDYTVIRGFLSGRNNDYRDGLAINAFEVTYYQTEPYGLERVELLRGPSSMIFGQADAGGVVNRVSKQPTGERIREVELQYGSFDRKQLAFDIGDRLGENSNLSYRLVGLHLDSNDQDQYPDGHKLNRTRSFLAPSLRWQPSDATTLLFFSEYLKSRSAEDPYYIGANYQTTKLKMGDYSYSGMGQEQISAGYRLEQKIGQRWLLQQNARYSRVTLDRRALWVDALDEDQRTIHRIARSWNDPLTQFGMDTHLTGKLQTGRVEHTVLAGVDLNRSEGKALRFSGAAPDLDLFVPVYGVAFAPPTDPVANYTQTTRQLGVYAQDQIKIDGRWVVTLGGRQDRVRQQTDDRLNASRTRQNDSAFSARGGLTYLLDGGWAPYLSYSESFLPNAGLDAQSNPFKPSRGKQTEGGIKYQPEKSSLLFTAALYDLQKTNIVSYDPVTFAGRQIGRQRSRGAEFEIKGEWLPGLNATASYTWLQSKILRSADPAEIDKRPAGVPGRTAAVWLDYALPDSGLGFGAGVRYMSDLADDEHNTSFRPSVTLVDAVVHYQLESWRLALNASNLFDKKYLSICYHGECYRGNQRALTLTARYRF